MKHRTQLDGAMGLSWLPLLPVLGAFAELAKVQLPALGAELPKAPVLRSEGGLLNCTLRLRPTRFVGANKSFVTRVYNDMIPGPTIVVQPGDRLLVNLKNDLEVPVGTEASNNYQLPNTTNLHVHGLHVSPSAPADEVFFTIVGPKQSSQYDYQIRADHSPGIYWAHPHHHGSTVVQGGAGAASALLVADPPGFLSEQLQKMPDHILMLQNLPFSLLEKAAALSGDELFQSSSPQEDLWLVNGAEQPTLTVKATEWHRLRLVMAGVSSWLYLSFGTCEVALLAKDGIYINDFPRFIQHVSLPPGGRAELAVRCPRGDVDTEHQVRSSSSPGSGVASYVGNLFSIKSVQPGELDFFEALTPWRPLTRPQYLQDLTGEMTAPDCSCKSPMGLGSSTRSVDGHLFQGPKAYLHQWPRDAVVQREISGINKHSFHQHTWPFQLQDTPAGNDPYFKAGDWHDTYQNTLDSKARVRFSTVDFQGTEVVHCHALAHSDQGMIGAEIVSGRGPEACACDLLGEEKVVELYGDAPSQSSMRVMTVMFAAMMLVAAAVAMQVMRASFQRCGVESRYVTLAPGP